jgi:hypothetical protein
MQISLRRPCVGILSLYGGPGIMPRSDPPRGALSHPDTLGCPLLREVIDGAWVETTVRGDPALEAPTIAAARRLLERGADLVTSNCGFLIRHQAAVAAALPVPVVLSSLLLVPALLRGLPSAGSLAILTYDSRCLTEDLLGLPDPADRPRVVVAGVEGGTYWKNELARPPVPTDPAIHQQEVLGCLEKACAAEPSIAAVLLECAGFPPFAPAIRARTGLPVFDITDLCRLALGGIGAWSHAATHANTAAAG